MVYQLEDVLDDDYSGELHEAVTVGIDIGSRGSKAVLLCDGKIYVRNVPSGVSTKETAKFLLTELLQEAKLKETDIKGIVGTGYGSVAMDFGQIPFWPITEITCHAMGAHYLHKATETVIDIGGQDSKAIRVEPDTGRVNDFVMNDKCAAGTGRFLEKVAQILEIPLDALGDTVLKSQNPSDISSQCVVFAESEVISLRANGTAKEDIVYGIHLASARRIQALLKKTGFKKDILFTGGVSNNVGMRRALEEVIGEKLAGTKLDPVYAGALGAAIYAHRNSQEGREKS
ncbi:MAG: acyl-CoA dehydratase activase [Agathobacter sp.]